MATEDEKPRKDTQSIYWNCTCLNCGRKGINVWRSSGQQRAKNHRKKLFCPWCGQTVNHIECKTDEEVENFKIRFEKGEFVDEARESITYINRNSGSR